MAQISPRKRAIGLAAIAGGIALALVLWLILLRFLPEPAAPANPLQFAIGCCAVSALLALVAGVEAIAHERLFTDAIDPLAGVETPRMRVNFRYLSNTVEQFIAFAAGLLAVSAYVPPRTLMIVTIAWVVSRWLFWLGYLRDPMLRNLGVWGMMQSMLVLLYAAYRFGREAYGAEAGVLLLILFGAIEAWLFWGALRPRGQ